ncbi:MAG: hypothetical protein U5Q16_06460 [Gammaproteobacteria bacterium]|nr:hypothetical protein [Gammaproteobacteria bacterium]
MAGSGGMDLSGYDGMTFNGGVVLQNGPTRIASNGSTMTFQGANTVSGPFDLELNAGSANVVGLDHLGTDLAGLHAMAGTVARPATGVSIAGHQSYTASEPGGINLAGDLDSTAAGDITFYSPVELNNSVLLTTTDSNVVFMDTLNGAHDLTLATGTGQKMFTGSVGASTAVGDGTGAALTLQGPGAGVFASTLQTSSGISAAGPVTFQDDVILGNGDTGSTFDGLVTAGDLSLSGHDGFGFQAGMNLVDGPLTVASQGAVIDLGGPVSGAQALILDTLSGGSGTVTGLQHIAGDLTGLTVTGQTLSLPATSLAVDGPMNFTAPGGISLNGDVGDGGTGAVTFHGPMTLATPDVAVPTDDADVLFDGSINGPHNLTVASGTGAKDFYGTMDIGSGSGAALALTGSGAAAFQQAVELASGLVVEDAADVRLHGDLLMADGDTGSDFGAGTVTLGASGQTARLHGHDGLRFGGDIQLVDGAVEIQSLGGDLTVEGALLGNQFLTLVGSGGSSAYFNGAVGGAAADDAVGGGQGLAAAGFTQMHFAGDVNLSGGLDVVGDVEFRGDVSTAAGAISNRFGGDATFNAVGGTQAAFAGLTEFLGAVSLASSDVVLQAGDDLSFTGPVDGTQSLTINGDETVAFDRVGSSDPLASLAVAADEIVLSDDVVTAGGNATFTGPIVLHGDASVSSNGGDIRLVGSTSTIDGAHDLTLSAGTGNVDLGGVVGGIDPLTNLAVSGYDLTLPRVVTTPVTAQTYAALNDLTLTQSRSMNGPVQFSADADADGNGTFVLLDGVSLTAVNNDLGILAADLDMQGSSTLNSGSGQIGLGATAGRSVGIGDDAAGPDRMHVSNDELSRMSSTGGLAAFTAVDGDIHVGTVGNADTSNLTGVLALDAGIGGNGNVNFTGDSVFQSVAATAGGAVDLSANLTTRGGDVVLHSAAAVTGPAVISTQGGDFNAQGALDLAGDLAVTSAGGHVSFDSSVDGPGDLALTLAGGDVSGLEQLQSTVGDLHVSADGTITVTDVTTGGTQTYDVGELGLNGTLLASGITANGPVVLSGNSTLDAGAGGLELHAGLNGGVHDLLLSGDSMSADAALQGTGTWHLQPGTAGRDVKVGGAAIGGAQLDLDDAFLAQISDGFAALTIGRGDGTGDIRMVADSVPDADLTLVSPGGDITIESDLDLGDASLALNGRSLGQTGGISAAGLDLSANGGAIDLSAAGNDFGPVALAGTPSTVALRNGRDIVQDGAWDLSGVDVTLDAGAHDVDLQETGNRFGALSLTGNNAAVASAEALELGATDLDGSLSIEADGTVSQSGGLTIGGDLSVVTTTCGWVGVSAELRGNPTG